jgi:hypothetical protein
MGLLIAKISRLYINKECLLYHAEMEIIWEAHTLYKYQTSTCAYVNPTVLNIYKYIWHDTLYLFQIVFFKEKNILSSCSFYFINSI